MLVSLLHAGRAISQVSVIVGSNKALDARWRAGIPPAPDGEWLVDPTPGIARMLTETDLRFEFFAACLANGQFWLLIFWIYRPSVIFFDILWTALSWLA
jgi:hypothetical protein